MKFMHSNMWEIKSNLSLSILPNVLVGVLVPNIQLVAFSTNENFQNFIWTIARLVRITHIHSAKCSTQYCHCFDRLMTWRSNRFHFEFMEDEKIALGCATYDRGIARFH